MKSPIMFLNSGYVTIPPALANQIRATPADSCVSVKFGYAPIVGSFATAEEATAEEYGHVKQTDDFKAKAISVRGWVFEKKSAGRDK